MQQCHPQSSPSSPVEQAVFVGLFIKAYSTVTAGRVRVERPCSPLSLAFSLPGPPSPHPSPLPRARQGPRTPEPACPCAHLFVKARPSVLAGSLVAPDETVPEVDSEEITRLESECTIWWQPPLWWDQTPMWMSRAPRWLNDVAVRDDSALLQVGEERGAEEAQAVAQLDESERARLDGLLERLRSQQHMVALNHHLVRGVDSVLARLEEPSTRAGRGGGEGAPA